jgi:alpha-N-arabinofuranosidase
VLTARVALHRDRVIGRTDPRLFGSFVEHLGRCVYGGIFEPGRASADAHGFRGDVLALTRELGPTLVRYPGGNFVSGYDWEDGVGPVDLRPCRLELAWLSTETNRFGTNEFMDWCKAANLAPMLAVNLGTRGADAARRLLEYCNHPGGTALSDLRAQHGWPAPHGVKLWCLGNEMDGPWQLETRSADDYGRIARETVKMMKWIDPGIELAACGSSGPNMPTFGEWERTVLQHTFEHVDYISLHTYINDYADDAAAFLAAPDLMDRFIDEVVAIADDVARSRGSAKRIDISLDEWNVWYRTRRTPQARTRPGWPVAPPLLEELYTMQDALAFGGMCVSLLNHADRVKIACLAQLVNAIAPIMTRTGGPAWRQTIFHPFAQMSRFGRGAVLRAHVQCPTYAAEYYDPRGAQDRYFPLRDVPFLKLAAVHDGDAKSLTLFALNRNLEEEMRLEVSIEGFPLASLIEMQVLHDADMRAVNTEQAPDRVTPRESDAAGVRDATIEATLPPASWSVIRLKLNGSG